MIRSVTMPGVVLCAAFALVACDRGDTTTPPATDPTSAPAAAAPPTAAEAPERPSTRCQFSVAELGIESVQLRSDDGCRLYLPLPPEAGEYAVRISSAGERGMAAIEAAGVEGRLFATSGTVTVTAYDAATRRVQGRVDASDDAAPNTGKIVGEFDLVLPGE